MNITIGELVNVLIPYTSRIELLYIDTIPIIKAYLQRRNMVCRALMYIAQTNENSYTVIDNCDDINNRIYLSSNKEKPFVVIKEIIPHVFSMNTMDFPEDISIKKDIRYTEFIDYLYQRLFYYGIIKFNPKYFNTIITQDMNINSNKIKNIINKRFKENNKQGTIRDLIEIVHYKKKPFDLENLKPRELGCVTGKLRDIGLSVTVENNVIIDIEIQIERNEIKYESRT